jgi:hypothetical protein
MNFNAVYLKKKIFFSNKRKFGYDLTGDNIKRIRFCSCDNEEELKVILISN